MPVFQLQAPTPVSAPSNAYLIKGIADAMGNMANPFDKLSKINQSWIQAKDAETSANVREQIQKQFEQGKSLGDAEAALAANGFTARDFANADTRNIYKNYLDDLTSKDSNIRANNLDARQERETQIKEKQEARANDKYHRIELAQEARNAEDHRRKLLNEDIQQEVAKGIAYIQEQAASRGSDGKYEYRDEYINTLKGKDPDYIARVRALMQNATGISDNSLISVDPGPVEPTPNVFAEEQYKDTDAQKKYGSMDTKSQEYRQGLYDVAEREKMRMENVLPVTLDANGKLSGTATSLTDYVTTYGGNDPDMRQTIEANVKKVKNALRKQGFDGPDGVLNSLAIDLLNKAGGYWFKEDFSDTKLEALLGDNRDLYQRIQTHSRTSKALAATHEAIENQRQIEATYAFRRNQILNDTKYTPEAKAAVLKRLDDARKLADALVTQNLNQLMPIVRQGLAREVPIEKETKRRAKEAEIRENLRLQEAAKLGMPAVAKQRLDAALKHGSTADDDFLEEVMRLSAGAK